MTIQGKRTKDLNSRFRGFQVEGLGVSGWVAAVKYGDAGHGRKVWDLWLLDMLDSTQQNKNCLVNAIRSKPENNR